MTAKALIGRCTLAAARTLTILALTSSFGIPSAGLAAPPARTDRRPQMSAPPDRRQYVRKVAAREVQRRALASALPSLLVSDVVISNTNPLLANGPSGGSEPGIAVNPTNPSQIVISSFDLSWNTNPPTSVAPLFYSQDGGSTWSQEMAIPEPPDVVGVIGCPCDQTFDYGRNGQLYGTVLLSDSSSDTGVSNIVTGSTSDPTNSSAWKWNGDPAQFTNYAHPNNVDQPWLVVGRDPSAADQDNVYVAYDDFNGAPDARVAVSYGVVPVSITADNRAGTASPSVTNPGLRIAADGRNGYLYALYEQSSGASQPRSITYKLNRSTDGGKTWQLNGSSDGITIATVASDQAPGYKFGTVNALLGGIDHLAVDPTIGDVYIVYGEDTPGSGIGNQLYLNRIQFDGSGNASVGTPAEVTNAASAALPSVAITTSGVVGVLYDSFDGTAVDGFPSFSAHFATSGDKGQTFTDTVLLQFESPATDNGDGRQRVLGDFQQLKASGSSFNGAFSGNRSAFGSSTSVIDPMFFSTQANGELMGSVNFSQQCSSGLGVGLTFDGTNLWYSCYASTPDLYRADPKTGLVTASYTIVGGLGSLAYDVKRNAIWAGWGGASIGNITLISLDASENVTGSSTAFFATNAAFAAIEDGLAYDVQDDSLYISPDTSTTIYHFGTEGNFISSFPWAGTSCYNSGVGIGGNLLFEGSDGCNEVWVVDKTTQTLQFSFNTGGTRDESLTCDNKTFGTDVMWSKEAYTPMRAFAFSIPTGTCGIGGQVPISSFNQAYSPASQTTPLFLDSKDGCFTVAAGGCALTSLADVMASYGMTSLPNGQAVNPDTLNAYLATIPGQQQEGCNLAWGIDVVNLNNDPSSSNLLGSTTVQFPPYGNDPGIPWSTRQQSIDASLSQGNLVIISVPSKLSASGVQFVVLYQKLTNPDGTEDYRIIDPANPSNNGLTLSQTFGSPQTIGPSSVQVVTFSSGSHPQRTFVLQTHSPVQFLVTDPNGVETGFNSTSNSYLRNILGATYGFQQGLASVLGGSSLPGSEYFQLDNPLDGTYTVQVIGTGSGPYQLDSILATAAGSSVSATASGTATPGSSSSYKIQVNGSTVVIQNAGPSRILLPLVYP